VPTDFSKIVYDDAEHSYTINGKRLISASTIANLITPAFDRDGLSASIAVREGKTKEEVLKDWDKKGKQGRDRGSRLHQFVEDTIDGIVDPVLQAVNDPIPEMKGFQNAWGRLVAGLGAKVRKKEWIIGDEELGVAGRIDLLVAFNATAGGREYCVFDWKTGKFDERTYGSETLLPPLAHVPSNKLTQYSVQLSIYRLILERNTPGEKFGDGYLVHLRPDGTHNVFRAKDYRKELLAWLRAGAPGLAHDPEKERLAKQLVRRLEQFSAETAALLSAKTRRRLGVVAGRVKGLCDDCLRP